MHGKIFQITKTRVAEDCCLNETTLIQGGDSFFDYCAEIDDKQRKFHIENLVNSVLPEGMFELISEDTIRYNGGAEQWREAFVNDIRCRAEITRRSISSFIFSS